MPACECRVTRAACAWVSAALSCISAHSKYISIASQVLLYKALGFTPPTFGHMSLILASDKSKLSKR